MNWTVQLAAHDFSAYEFLSDSGKKIVCKFNRSQGSLRFRSDEHYGVFMIDANQLINRKFSLSNVYGSEVGIVIKNMWHENTGHITFNNFSYKLNYKIDSYSSFMEVSDKEMTHHCEFKLISHPGREEHFMPVLISLAWMQLVTTGISMEKTL